MSLCGAVGAGLAVPLSPHEVFSRVGACAHLSVKVSAGDRVCVSLAAVACSRPKNCQGSVPGLGSRLPLWKPQARREGGICHTLCWVSLSLLGSMPVMGRDRQKHEGTAG